MKTLLMKVEFGRKGTKEKTFRLFADYNDAVDFIRAWTSDGNNWASNPVWTPATLDVFNKVWNIEQ